MSFLKDNNIDYNEIPDSLNLEGGVYRETAVTSGKVIVNKKTELPSLILTIKDQDPDSDTCGKDFGLFIGLPHPSMSKADLDTTLYRYKKTLKNLGLSDHQIENLSDPEMDEQSKDWLLEIEGILHLKKNGEYTNMVKFERTSPNSTVTQGGGEVRKKSEPVESQREETNVAPVTSSDDWD